MSRAPYRSPLVAAVFPPTFPMRLNEFLLAIAAEVHLREVALQGVEATSLRTLLGGLQEFAVRELLNRGKAGEVTLNGRPDSPTNAVKDIPFDAVLDGHFDLHLEATADDPLSRLLSDGRIKRGLQPLTLSYRSSLMKCELYDQATGQRFYCVRVHLTNRGRESEWYRWAVEAFGNTRAVSEPERRPDIVPATPSIESILDDALSDGDASRCEMALVSAGFEHKESGMSPPSPLNLWGWYKIASNTRPVKLSTLLAAALLERWRAAGQLRLEDGLAGKVTEDLERRFGSLKIVGRSTIGKLITTMIREAPAALGEIDNKQGPPSVKRS